MKLRDIYERRIDRHINPAVVIGDQDQNTIKAEIEEYIFTDDLIEKLFLMLDTVLNKKEGKTGIWINGYYGSGKSHFIKFINYLLDPVYSEDAFKRLETAVSKYDETLPGKQDHITVSNLIQLQKRIQKSECDKIMFNVEEETDDQDRGQRFTRILLNMFNKFRGYNSDNIALANLLEKELDKRGKFEEFKKLINEKTTFDWDQDAATVAAFQLQDVLDVAKSLIPEIDTVSLHSRLSNLDSYKIGINATLIPELQEFLKDKDKDYRLLFLVDEVSQYIGTNKEILLNFQSIIESISKNCNNQVWIACTAQQTLDEVSIGADGVTDVQDEFGKILGRFDTRISLQSNDAAYITQRRVLDKNSKGIKYVSKLYQDNKDYIENQFKINHDLFKGYQNEEEFVNGYPFVPYQFRLIAHVFEAFQQLQFVIKEVKDNERSVLGITHFTAKQTADQDVGGFIPFDAFFNKQFENNLTHRGKRAVENGLELSYVKNNPFAARVVKVLFMISNLLEKQRQTFPSNVENLGVLLMDTLDQNKMQLHRDIQEVLDKLIEESIIRKENNSYFFFNEDEIDVQNLIKNQPLILDDRLSTFDDIFRSLTSLSQKVSFGQNDFRLNYSVEGKDIYRNGDFHLMVLLTDQTPTPQKALDVNKKDLVICINEWFLNDESLRKDFDWHVKTNKFLSNTSGGNGERSRTIENFRIRNNELRNKIITRIENYFSETRFISQNTIVDSNAIGGTTPKDRVKNIIDYHLSGIYNKHHLAADYAKNQMELRASAADQQVPLPTLTPAERLVNDFIQTHGGQMTVYDLINEYEKDPFGWRFEAVLDVLIQLVKKKKREFVYKGQPRYPIVDFINKAVTTSERMSCQVVSVEEIDQVILDDMVAAYNYVFNENINPATDKNILYEDLMDALKRKLEHHQDLEQTYFGKYPFGNCFQQGVKQLTAWIQTRDIKRFFETFIEEKENSKELFDKTKGISDFANRALKEIDDIRLYMRDNDTNFKEMMMPEVLEKAKEINSFLGLDDPRNDFRHIRKAFDEIKKDLKDFSNNLKEEIKQIYSEAFDELEKEAKQRKVDANTYADRDYTLQSIDKISSIPALQNKKLSVSEFKSNQLQKIIEATEPGSGSQAAEPTSYYVTKGTATISSEEELDAYLEKLRKEMTALLKEEKIIILR